MTDIDRDAELNTDAADNDAYSVTDDKFRVILERVLERNAEALDILADS
ncbi:MAG: hypothetical protein M3137_18180 [Actinomycetota bacterium]|nr:hypothetical protein [Actinomycetota bacterium]